MAWQTRIFPLPFGRLWTEAALDRADKVVATASNPDTLAELAENFGVAILTLQLDVIDRAAVFAVVKRGTEHFGRIDVVISNAGYGALGMIEELDFDTVRQNFETNFFWDILVDPGCYPSPWGTRQRSYPTRID